MNTFEATLAAVKEADELRKVLRRVRRERDLAHHKVRAAQKSRDVWKQRCYDAEWMAGIRRERKEVA